jgi:hypothetical protein
MNTINKRKYKYIPKINCSLEVLTRDIRATSDPLKKIILRNFIDLKIKELREDPSVDGLSDNDLNPTSNFKIKHIKHKNVDTSGNNSSDDHNENNEDFAINKKKKILEAIHKKQESGLQELDKISKMKAYAELIEDNKKESKNDEIKKKRGNREEKWKSHDIHDPKYEKYIKEDSMNNKLMERLNSEIDFRMDDVKVAIEKPFDDDDDDQSVLDGFARFEATDDNTTNDTTNDNKKLTKRKYKNDVTKKVLKRRNLIDH